MLWSFLGATFISGVLIIQHRQSAVTLVVISLIGSGLVLRGAYLKALLSKIRTKKNGRAVIYTAATLTVTAALYFTVISGLMVSAMARQPLNEATLIVLGARVRGDTPSLVLRRRLEAAYQFLSDKPGAVAILSGGQGSSPGEWITEAEAMRRYLTARGISEDRLFLEEHSNSTYENLSFSRAIIDKNGFHKAVAIATDGFHQYRAQHYAKNAGLVPGAVSSRTPFGMLPFYWLREVAAITVQIVFRRSTN